METTYFNLGKRCQKIRDTIFLEDIQYTFLPRGLEYLRLYSIRPVNLIRHDINSYGGGGSEHRHLHCEINEVLVAGVQGDLVKTLTNWEEEVGINDCSQLVGVYVLGDLSYS